jgi:Raf kinase inhibitor-like YbhB/YbcL family protein
MRRVVLLGAGLVLVACGGSGGIDRLALTSPAFVSGSAIPPAYTCDGNDISPPLHWSGVPSNATELRLSMVDTDARGFIHWQVSMISPRATGVHGGDVPVVAIEGTNSFGTTGYRGPCPPRGARPHHYVITLTALAGEETVATGTLTGTYSR